MNSMIATVGSNPMPVALLALHCGITEIHLIYTAGVAQTFARLKSFFEKRAIKTQGHEISEGDNLSGLRSKIKSFRLPTEAVLNYTAGTKHMSVGVHHAVHELWSKPGELSQAAYLSGDEVLWDNRGPEKLKAEISLEEILTLHFDEAPQPKSDQTEIALSEAIYGYVRNNGWDQYKKLLPPLHGSKISIPELEVDGKKYENVFLTTFSAEDDKNFKKAFRDFPLSDWFREVKPSGFASIEEVPKYTSKPEKLKGCYRLLYSEWPELWLLQYLRSLRLFDEVIQGAAFTKKDDNPEIDLLARKGHRLFLISCTTDDAPYIVKSKAFEAFQRSRRLGGDQTRYAVFSFASNQNLAKLITTVEDERWEGSGLFRAFGYEHLIGNSGPCKKGENPEMTLEEAIRDWLR